jgi:la-related protein 1
MYGRAPGYPGGPQAAIQTFMAPMYDYPMMQPMSAVPYSPYGVDQITLLGMVATQMYDIPSQPLHEPANNS